MYWIGKSVLNHKGKDYGFGDELPETLPAESIKAFKAKGRIADKVPTIKEAAAVKGDKELKARVKELTGKLDAAEGTVKKLTGKLDAAEETVGELTQKVKDSEKTIAELTKQITDPGKGKK